MKKIITLVVVMSGVAFFALDIERYPEIGHLTYDNVTDIDELNNIVSPVLLLWGKEDRILHVSSTDVWEAGVDNIKITIFSGIGHMPMVEVPVRTADVYKAFLDNLGFGGDV